MQLFDHAQIGPTFVDIYHDPPTLAHKLTLCIEKFAALKSLLGCLFRQ